MPGETAFHRYIIDGGVMMVFLVPLAFLTVAFVVQGFINLRRARVCPPGFGQRLPALLAPCRTSAEVESALAREGHSLAAILRRVLRHLDLKADADAAEALNESIAEECDGLQHRNSKLSVVYNVAPLMGLLGTVFGILGTFRQFAESADPSVRDLSLGINVALITTAWGLSIAIPAFLFLHVFLRKISHYEQVMFPAECTRALESILAHLNAVPPEAPAESADGVT